MGTKGKHVKPYKSNKTYNKIFKHRKVNFTLSDKVFNETNAKDNTGMRVAVCPCDASSCDFTIISSNFKNT